MSSAIVRSVLDKYPNLLTIPKDQLQARRQQFIPHIIDALNNPKWGYLIKSGGKVQDDIVVDKTNMHHFDCLSAVDDASVPSGHYRITAAWKDQGVVPSQWKWGSINDYTVPPLPITDEPDIPDNPDVPNPPSNGLEAKVDTILSILNKHFK